MGSKHTYMEIRALLDFLRDFALLCEKQLGQIYILSGNSVSSMMNSIYSISDTTEKTKIGLESSVLPSSKKWREETDLFNKDVLQDEILSAVKKFSFQLEKIDLLDKEVHSLLYAIIASASVDDLIRQRITHTMFSVSKFNEMLATIISDFDGKLTIPNIKNFRNRILTEIYRSYTSEEERRIFHSVFGEPLQKNKELAG